YLNLAWPLRIPQSTVEMAVRIALQEGHITRRHATYSRQDLYQTPCFSSPSPATATAKWSICGGRRPLSGWNCGWKAWGSHGPASEAKSTTCARFWTASRTTCLVGPSISFLGERIFATRLFIAISTLMADMGRLWSSLSSKKRFFGWVWRFYLGFWGGGREGSLCKSPQFR
ncbi:unnamed protein product, partial [Phaeothamnion confervicola]